jgi:hypothetical protein
MLFKSIRWPLRSASGQSGPVTAMSALGAKRTFTRERHFVTDKELAKSYPVLHGANENALFDTWPESNMAG